MSDSVQRNDFSGINSTDQEIPQAFQPVSEYSVNVSIEPNHETEIFEVRFDDNNREVTEVYKEPPSYSDKLAELISKIDFGELIQEKTVESSTAAPSSQASNQTEDVMTARKLFQNIYERIKLSLDEICVLLDLLTLVKGNKLMTIEEGHEHLTEEFKQSDVTEKTISVLLKRKNIEKAKTLLKKSLEKISNDQEYSNIKFHLELYRARQLWKIRKIGTKFTCDLSYRSVGCINAIKVNIELNKNDIPLNPQETNPTKALYLSAIIPEEFKDYAYIQVKIVKTINKGKKDALFDSKFSLFTYNHNSSNPLGCQEMLEREQNSLYCREIYENILREIFDPNNQNQMKPIMIGNSIQIMVNMEYDLIINLVHTRETLSNQQCPKNYNYDNAILEYYLHCLLKKSFDQNFFHYDQRPITSTFAFNSNIKIAGMAYANLNLDEEESVISIPHNISHLLNKNRKINLLQSIKEKAEHLILRKKVLKILNSISKNVGPIHLIVEQSAWNSAISSDITIIISSYYFTSLAKSFFYIRINKSNVSILNRSDNISISFTDSLIDLKEYFINQCCYHQINLLITLCQQYGWTVLGSSFTSEENKQTMTGAALVYNNTYSKKIAIKVEQVNRIQVFVNQYNASDSSPLNNSEVKNLFDSISVDWIFLKETFTPIDLKQYPDFTDTQRFELFLAHYSTPYFVEQL